ncbi:MAG: hypothetical protein ACXAD7_10860 [Candidatus Kariarchaeaceae archaeon]
MTSDFSSVEHANLNKHVTTSRYYSDDLEYLLEKSRILDNQIKILLAWECRMSAHLQGDLSNFELISLHNIEPFATLNHLSINQFGRIFDLYYLNDLVLSFHLCNHGVYTPIDPFSADQIRSDCLFCCILK